MNINVVRTMSHHCCIMLMLRLAMFSFDYFEDDALVKLFHDS